MSGRLRAHGLGIALGLDVLVAVVLWFVGEPVRAVLGVLAAGALALALWPRRRPAPWSGPWLVITAALAVVSITYLGVGLFDRAGGLPVVAVVGHGTAAALLAVGIAWLTWVAVGRDIMPVLDALIVTCGGGLTLYVVFVPPALASTRLPVATVVLAMLSVLMLIAALVYLAVARPRPVASVLLLVAGGLAVILATAVGHHFLVAGDATFSLLVAVLQLTAMYLVGLAVHLRPARLGAVPQRADQTGLYRVALISAGALAAPVLVFVQLVSGVPLSIAEALVSAALLIGLTMGRTAIMVRRLAAQAARLAGLVDTDPVTGLANRGRLEREIALARSGAVVLLDVDRYTELRDALGSRIADAMLREVADRVTGGAGPRATVARLGSAVFGVLLPDARTPEQALGRAGLMQRTCLHPLEISGFTIDVDVAAGYALIGADGARPEELLDRADVALRVAALRPSRVVGYRREDGDGSTAPVLVAELPTALRRGELVLHFQPQVSLATGRVFALEALVRWQHPERGLLPPAAFVPAAERTGLVRAVTRFVLDRALQSCAQWHDQGHDVAVAVNLSVHDLLDPTLVDAVRRALEEHGVSAEKLELEVTETMAMVDPRRAMATLGALAELGVVLSVDDYGTGHSSLAYLQRLPVRRLKIDRSFVAGLTRDESSRTIVASTIDLAGRLGLEVVAEGVEDAATLEVLRSLRCDAVQGYGLARPVPHAEVADVIRSLDHPVPHPAPGPGGTTPQDGPTPDASVEAGRRPGGETTR